VRLLHITRWPQEAGVRLVEELPAGASQLTGPLIAEQRAAVRRKLLGPAKSPPSVGEAPRTRQPGHGGGSVAETVVGKWLVRLDEPP
jgi:hypothetical protein